MDNLTQSTFRQRCASALTHPLTVGALGVLLLNDLVLKQLWANPWTTGKLSDLAWVVFASPLLAWLLLLVARENRRGQRAAWIAAYIGLPLLYAAFNTFPAVHDAVLSGFSLVSGGTAGSPLDPTDSLVIPVGLGIALWVWRRGAVAPGDLRRRLTALTAGVAVVASVATSMAEPGYGVTHIWTVEPGAVIASDGISAAPYESLDGGFTWRPGTTGPTSGGPGSAAEAVTPRGTYVLGDTAVVLVKSSDDVQEVYSTDYLQGAANEWVQRRQTEHLGGTRVTTTPHSIIYDEQSGNVVVSLGLQGVVVGTPSGAWRRVGVGPYQPSEFSGRKKSELLVEYSGLWALVISLALAGVCVSIWVSDLITTTIRAGSWLTGLRLLIAFLLVVVTVLLAMGTMGTFADPGYGSLISPGLVGVMMSVFSAFVALCVLMLCWRQLYRWYAILTSFAVTCGLTVLVFIIWVQGIFGTDFALLSAALVTALTGAALVAYLQAGRPRNLGNDHTERNDA